METLYKQATSMEPLTNFSFDFFMKFLHKMPLYFFLYHGAKKVKNDQKLKSRGPALKPEENIFLSWGHRISMYLF